MSNLVKTTTVGGSLLHCPSVVMHRAKNFGNSYVRLQGPRAFHHQFVAVSTQCGAFRYTTCSVKRDIHLKLDTSDVGQFTRLHGHDPEILQSHSCRREIG